MNLLTSPEREGDDTESYIGLLNSLERKEDLLVAREEVCTNFYFTCTCAYDIFEPNFNDEY